MRGWIGFTLSVVSVIGMTGWLAVAAPMQWRAINDHQPPSVLLAALVLPVALMGVVGCALMSEDMESDM